MPSETTIAISVNTIKGTIAGMVATFVTHPLDVHKVRRQISPRRTSTFIMTKTMLGEEGWRPFYCGLTAALARQMTNTATRLTVYETLRHKYVRTNTVEPEPRDMIWMGVISSMAGGVVGNPCEMVLIRRMADGCHFLAPSGSCRVDGAPSKTFDSFIKIIREEGFLTLWRGCPLTLLRSVMVNVMQVVCYEYIQLHEKMRKHNVVQDEYPIWLYSLILTHLFSAIATHPVDRLKNFYQLSKNKKDTILSILKLFVLGEGIIGMLRGFPPYFARMTLHAIIQFMVFERL